MREFKEPKIGEIWGEDETRCSVFTKYLIVNVTKFSVKYLIYRSTGYDTGSSSILSFMRHCRYERDAETAISALFQAPSNE